MADDKPKTVKVEALQAHSYNGKDYVVGATYDLDEQLVESLRIQGKAVRVDRAEVAKAETKAAEKSQAAAAKPAKAAKTVKAKTVKKRGR